MLEQFEAVFDAVLAAVVLDDPGRLGIGSVGEEQVLAEALALFGDPGVDLLGALKDRLATSPGKLNIVAVAAVLS